jgi:hypothetical protein
MKNSSIEVIMHALNDEGLVGDEKEALTLVGA